MRSDHVLVARLSSAGNVDGVGWRRQDLLPVDQAVAGSSYHGVVRPRPAGQVRRGRSQTAVPALFAEARPASAFGYGPVGSSVCRPQSA